MVDELISFKTAKLAKEKGFDIPVGSHWDLRIPESTSKLNRFHLNNPKDFNTHCADIALVSAPTQSLLQKWLREEHKVYFNITPMTIVGYIAYYKIEVAISSMIWDEPLIANGDTYEEALEKGLIKALKLI